MSEPLVTARAIAEQLGMSVAWVLDRFEAGELPGFKYGDSAAAPVRFRPSEVEHWLECRRRGPRLHDRQAPEAGR
jgi:predicted DNA-binding transcriptional regulator AlpA